MNVSKGYKVVSIAEQFYKELDKTGNFMENNRAYWSRNFASSTAELNEKENQRMIELLERLKEKDE